jgi:TPR repeat protein
MGWIGWVALLIVFIIVGYVAIIGRRRRDITEKKLLRQDYAGAVDWYRKAADQGDPNAQANLGLMYADGLGVPQDYVIALMWFGLAAAGGHAFAAKSRDDVAANMTASQIAEAQRLAREWKSASNSC